MGETSGTGAGGFDIRLNRSFGRAVYQIELLSKETVSTSPYEVSEVYRKLTRVW